MDSATKTKAKYVAPHLRGRQQCTTTKQRGFRPDCCPCRHGENCVKFGCRFEHPPTRIKECIDGASCMNAECALLHPVTDFRRQTINRPCRHGANCVKFGCRFRHPKSRAQDCPDGAFCARKGCAHLHPRTRIYPHNSEQSPRKQQIPLRQTEQPEQAFENVSVATKAHDLLASLTQRKLEAVCNEAYMQADGLKERIAALKSLIQRKQEAIVAERYIDADVLNNKIAALCEQQLNSTPANLFVSSQQGSDMNISDITNAVLDADTRNKLAFRSFKPTGVWGQGNFGFCTVDCSPK